MQHQPTGEDSDNLLRDPTQHRFDQQQLGSPDLSVIPLPENKAALQKEIRFNMAYC